MLTAAPADVVGRPDEVLGRPADDAGRGVGFVLIGTWRILISESIYPQVYSQQMDRPINLMNIVTGKLKTIHKTTKKEKGFVIFRQIHQKITENNIVVRSRFFKKRRKWLLSSLSRLHHLRSLWCQLEIPLVHWWDMWFSIFVIMMHTIPTLRVKEYSLFWDIQ
jgi:hypothetical protein